MKSFLTLIVFLLVISSSFSQTSKYIVIIEDEPVQKPLMLLDNNQELNSLYTVNYSEELKDHSKKFNFSAANISIINNGLITDLTKAFKKDAFKDYNINYQRTTLKRLLPGPPSFENFCPEFSH